MYATCETPDCWNELKPLEVPTDVTVMCGVCGQEVTNITDVRPEEGTVLPQWILDQLATQNSGD